MTRSELVWTLLVGVVEASIMGWSYYAEFQDKSWGALGVIMIFNPGANLALCILSMFFGWIFWDVFKLRPKLVIGTALGIPSLGGFISFLAASTIRMHGC